MAEHRAVVALGANLPSVAGSPLQTLAAALAELQVLSMEPVVYSSPYCSKPADCEPGAADFINAVALLSPRPDLDPHGLLAALLQIEENFGRERHPDGRRSRTLDLDLVCWGQRQVASADLVLPHPRATVRSFVLAPLVELVPDFQLPGAPVSVRELLSSLPTAGDELQRLSWPQVSY